MIRTTTVTTPRLESTCPIWVGRGLITSLPTLLNASAYSTVTLVVDRGAESVGEEARRALRASSESLVSFEAGEHHKTIDSTEQLWRFFMERKLDRKSLVLAVGGGALTDLVGFACATYMRGVACVTVPTTLLAQVDAGIGGKTGINFGGIKNLIGCVKQPAGIVVDIDALATLPARQIRAGFAEIAKHGLIADPSYFRLVTSKPSSAWSPDELVAIVHASCEIKARIVEQDETEQGIRKALNFGHTLGHAIEAAGLEGASPLTHGECVAIGMAAACHISRRMGLLSDAEAQKATDGLRLIGLPTKLTTARAADTLLEAMTLDKKSVAGRARWTLLTAIGSAAVDCEVPLELVREAIEVIQPH